MSLIAMTFLKIAAYCVYLAAWLVFAVAAVLSAIPRLGKPASVPTRVSPPAMIGMLLQAAAAFLVTRSMASGPLHPRLFELFGALLLAPSGAAIFVWAIRSAPSGTGSETLVTKGAYSWLRHPIYLAFLAMLLATGLLVSSGIKLILPVLLYISGSELRISSEEEELAGRFRESYAEYRNRTRWRYLPGLR